MGKNYYYAAELIEPVDRPITKTLALKLYKQVLATDTQLSPVKRCYFAREFAESIDIYRAELDNASEIVRIDDLKDNIQQLREEIEELDEELDDASADDIDYEAFDRRNNLKAKLKEKQQELKTLAASEKKLHNKDLRFYLAAELMWVLHKKPQPSALEIAQQTQDYWEAQQSRKQNPSDPMA